METGHEEENVTKEVNIEEPQKEETCADEKEEEKVEDKVEGKQEETSPETSSEPKKNNKKWIVGICLGFVVLIIIAAVYIAGVVYYRSHFFRGTIINGTNYGSEEVVAVMAVLSAEMQDYQLELRGRDPGTGKNGKLVTILAQDIDLKTTTGKEDVEGLLAEQNEWRWPEMLGNIRHEYFLTGDIFINEDKLDAFLDNLPAFQKDKMTAPEDAYLKGYSEQEKSFVLEPEVYGTQLDVETAQKAVLEAIYNEQRILDLEELGCYAKPAVTTEDAKLQAILGQANQYLRTEITYDWNGSEVVLNVEQLKEWISVEGGKVLLDEDAVGEFVAENAKKNDTYGRDRKFVTTLGIELTLQSKYGWRVDRKAEKEALIDLIKEGAVEKREPVYTYKAVWKGQNDIGNSYVEIDLTHQHLYLYQAGEIILETDFVSGNMSNGNATPPGIFGLTYKTRNAVLRGADYATPVNYWMPFNGNVGMHDATWRGAFGGDIFMTSGSHGCINLPLSKAAEIYEYVSENFPVICYYYPEGTELPSGEENPEAQEGEYQEGEYVEIPDDGFGGESTVSLLGQETENPDTEPQGEE